MVRVISVKGNFLGYEKRKNENTIFCINEDNCIIKINGCILIYEKIIDKKDDSVVPTYKEGELILHIPDKSVNYILRMNKATFTDKYWFSDYFDMLVGFNEGEE